MMLIRAVLCLCVIAAFLNTVQTNALSKSLYSTKNGQTPSEFSVVDNVRHKRAFRGIKTAFGAVKAGYVVLKGLQAVRILTKNAKPVYFTETYKYFKKSGGYRAALKDWQALKPQNINVVTSKEGVRMEGEVGDRLVSLIENHKIGETVVDISRIPNTFKEGALKIEIEYTN